MDKLQELKEKRVALETRILKVLRIDGVQGIDSCKKDINDLCKISSAISVLETESPMGLLMLFLDDALYSFVGDQIMVNCKLGSAIMDSAGFAFKPAKVDLTSNSGKPFPIGKYNDYELLVDPNMKWTDSRIMVYRRGLSEMDGFTWQEFVRIPEEIFSKLKF